MKKAASVLRKFFFTGIGLVLIGLSRFVFNEVSQLKYGLEHTGQLNIALSLAILMSMPAVTSFVPSLLRFVANARGEGDEGRAHKITSLLGRLTVVVLALIALAMFLYRDEIVASRQIKVIHVYYAISVLLAGGTYQFVRNLCYAMGKVGTYSALEFVAGLGFGSVLLLLVLLDLPDHLLLAFVVSHLIFAVGGLFLFRRPPAQPAKKPVEYSAIFAYSFWAFIATSASWGIRELSVIISADFADLKGAAHIGWCVAFLTPMQFFPRVIRTVIFADTAEKTGRGENEKAAASVSEVSHWIATFNLPFCGLLVLFAPELLEMLTTNTNPEFVMVLRFMIIAIAFDTLSTSASSALSGAGHIRLIMVLSSTGLLAAITVWLGLGLDSGVLGVSLGLLSASVIRGAGVVVAGWRKLSITLSRRPFHLIMIVILLGATMAASQMGISLYACGAFYFVGVLVVIRVDARELFAKIQQRIQT